MSKPTSILIIRLSALGDVVMATPLLRALRRHYPSARIAWLVQSDVAELLTAQPGLDELIIWPRKQWKQRWQQGERLAVLREVWRFIVDLRQRRFDLVLDATGLLKSGVWAFATGAARRVGLGSQEGSQWLMTQVVAKDRNDPRYASEYLELLEALGIPPGDWLPEIGVSPEAKARAQALLAEAGMTGPYAVCCPFTTRPQKHWVEAQWAILAQNLADDLGLTPVLLGGPADQAAAERILADTQGKARSFVGRTRLLEAAAIIAGADLLVGVDTGLTHMGPAFNVPTLALFGSTCPYTQVNRDNVRVIYLKKSCSPCHRSPTCGGAFSCMTEITAERVLLESRAVLKR